MAEARGPDMEPWEASVFAAAHETLAITMFRDLYGDEPNPKQWALADDETKKTWRVNAMEIMIDAAMLAKHGPQTSNARNALVLSRQIIVALIDAEYNVETWGLRGRLAAIDEALGNATDKDVTETEK